MAAITSLDPPAGAQGTLLKILGADLAGCDGVTFAGLGRESTIAPSYISDGEVRAHVPSFDGVGGLIAVSVQSDGSASNALAFDLTPYPAVEEVHRLASLGALRLILGVGSSDTFDELKYGMMLDAASATIARECGLDFRQTVIVGELLDGDGSPLLTLPRGPVRSVQGLRIAGQAIDPAEAKVYPSYIRFEEGEEYNPRLRSTGRIFPRGTKNIGVDYTAGFAAVPYDIQQACIEQVCFIVNTLTKAGVAAESNSQSNSSTTYAQVPLAPSVLRTINRYRPTKVTVI